MPLETRPRPSEPRSASGPREIVEEHFMDVYAVCLRVLGRPHDAEDATQETFLALFRQWDKASAAESLRGWVLTVARNTAVSMFRARKPSRPLLEALVEAGPIEEPADPDRLHDAMAGLAEEERHLVQMRFLEGKSPADMAAATGRTAGAAATALCRALRHLRELYEEGGR